MSDASRVFLEAMRERVRTHLGSLSPQEAKALRERFGLDTVDSTASEDEEALLKLAHELAMLKKKQ